MSCELDNISNARTLLSAAARGVTIEPTYDHGLVRRWNNRTDKKLGYRWQLVSDSRVFCLFGYVSATTARSLGTVFETRYKFNSYSQLIH